MNSEATLKKCLASINWAFPLKNIVGQKIVVDAHSVDDTKKIAEGFGWHVFDAEKTGIGHQANQALRHVKTELFASFEHDIVLHPNWFPHVIQHFRDPRVAVAQGVRLATNPTLRKIEQFALGRNQEYSSIDNTIYSTAVLRSLGGFPTTYPTGIDRALQQNVRSRGFKWIVDRTVVSNHLRTSVYATLKHNYGIALNDGLKRSRPKTFVRFAYSPFRALEILIKKQCPLALLVYPLNRLLMLLATLKKS